MWKRNKLSRVFSKIEDRTFFNFSPGLSVLFNFAPDAVLLVDEEGTIVNANVKAYHTFGWAIKDGLIGRNINCLIPYKYQELHDAHRKHYMLVPTLRPMAPDHRALYGKRKDGTEIKVEIGLSPLFLPGRKLIIAYIKELDSDATL